MKKKYFIVKLLTIAVLVIAMILYVFGVPIAEMLAIRPNNPFNRTWGNPFVLEVGELPDSVYVGDTILITATVRNRHPRFFGVGHGMDIIDIAVLEEDQMHWILLGGGWHSVFSFWDTDNNENTYI